MTKVTTLCIEALVRTAAIFVFTLVNICVKWEKIRRNKLLFDKQMFTIRPDPTHRLVILSHSET